MPYAAVFHLVMGCWAYTPDFIDSETSDLLEFLAFDDDYDEDELWRPLVNKLLTKTVLRPMVRQRRILIGRR